MILSITHDFCKFNFMQGTRRLPSKEGVKRIVAEIDYFRCLEDHVVFNNSELDCGFTLLDIGSSNTIFLLFAASKGMRVWATVIDDSVLELRGDAEKLKVANFCAEIQDARNLSYIYKFFDRVSVISTLEYIPNDGDSKAVKEMSRVLSRGIMVITVLYGTFEEERQRHIGYFQRVYNEEDIYKRLIEPSGLEIEQIKYFGETKHNFTKYQQIFPPLFRLSFLWAMPIFSKLFLGMVKDVNNLSGDEKNIFEN